MLVDQGSWSDDPGHFSDVLGLAFGLPGSIGKEFVVDCDMLIQVLD